MEQHNLVTETGTVLRRVGYKGTGFSFTFVECPDDRAFRGYVRKIPAVVEEPWMLGQGETPTGFTVMDNSPVFPGTIEEADGSFLCEVRVVAPTCGDPKELRRRFHHELGHAVDFAVKSGHRVAGDIEFPAYCTEFLCAALDAFLADEDEILSGFPHLFPWLGEKA